MPSNSSILTPYPADFKVPSVSAGFYKPTAGTGGGDPSFTGSAKAGLGVPQIGAQLRINQFGLDYTELSWMIQTALADQLKPEPLDPHPYLAGMNCTESSTTTLEGKMSLVRATYKGLVKNQIRPAERSISIDTRTDSVKLNNGTTTIGGGGGSGGGASNLGGEATSTANTLDVQSIPVPQRVYTLRGASAKEPDDNPIGTYFQNPPRAPTVKPLWEYPVVVTVNYVTQIYFVLQYRPHPLGWLMDKQEWDIAGLYYEVVQQYRMDYRLYSLRAPTPEEQPPANS